MRILNPFLCLLAIVSMLCQFSVSASAKTETAFSHGDRNEKKIALTFDDGPHPRYTPQILALLERYNIKATFFMIGSNVSLYPETAKAVHRAGHEIGCHTYSHPHMLKITACELQEEIRRSEAQFAQCEIPKPRLFRPPEGYRTEEQIAAVKAAGYRMIIWSVDTHDWKSISPKKIENYVLHHVQGGDIILFHDYISGQNTTIAALEQLIPQLLKDGYSFVTVSELIKDDA